MADASDASSSFKDVGVPGRNLSREPVPGGTDPDHAGAPGRSCALSGAMATARRAETVRGGARDASAARGAGRAAETEVPHRAAAQASSTSEMLLAGKDRRCPWRSAAPPCSPPSSRVAGHRPRAGGRGRRWPRPTRLHGASCIAGRRPAEGSRSAVTPRRLRPPCCGGPGGSRRPRPRSAPPSRRPGWSRRRRPVRVGNWLPAT